MKKSSFRYIKSPRWLNELSKSESLSITYRSNIYPVVLKKGLGMRVYDIDNNRYLDFIAGFGVLALGHRPKIVLNALRKQMAQMIHGLGDVHPNISKIKLLTKLKQLLPYQNPNIILASSGSEAVDTALKTCVLARGKDKFLSFQGAYHGVYTGPLRLCARKHFTLGFESWLGDKVHILPFPTKHDANKILTELEDELKTKTYAGLVLEPVQARGGNRCFPKDFIKHACDLAKKYQVITVFDEIFTGFGRTGSMFAYEQENIIPDIICLGKALGGGLPLSACAGEVLEVWGKSSGEARHTSTFLGHPLACAAGLATLNKLEEIWPKLKAELALIDQAFDNFASRNSVAISGRGFMRGIKFIDKPVDYVAHLCQQMLSKGFLLLPDGEDSDILAINPPLIASIKEYNKLFAAL
jgi:4-aminobutyrate aminotransferase-like enzyme